MSVSPDWFRAGVSPRCAPTAREEPNRSGRSIVARKVSAVIGPTPGALISRRQTSSLRTMSRTCFVRRANSLSMEPRIESCGSTITIASASASSRTPSAKAVREGLPSLTPASRRMARTTFSVLRISFSTVRRATNSARHNRLFTCTCRYQPVRMICASARASLRSVLLGIVFMAALAWRVSIQIAGRPSAHNPS
ncbi:hypothetical protein AJ88_46890 [Mesorhizobium amorphae CCBAU 01583]|nr:hypothetical protein AJ88_46890 [Mesorhizobium amorphae CCBAU 01583]